MFGKKKEIVEWVNDFIRREHKHRTGVTIRVEGVERYGTGFLVKYDIRNAFPHSVWKDDHRVAFVHEPGTAHEGVLWDRSCRWG